MLAGGNSEVIFRYTDGVATILGGLGEHNNAWGINASGGLIDNAALHTRVAWVRDLVDRVTDRSRRRAAAVR